MPTIDGLKITHPDGTLLGWQAECPYCGQQVRFVALTLEQSSRIDGRCQHYSDGGSPQKFEFSCTQEEERDRAEQREIDARIAQELDERRVEEGSRGFTVVELLTSLLIVCLSGLVTLVVIHFVVKFW